MFNFDTLIVVNLILASKWGTNRYCDAYLKYQQFQLATLRCIITDQPIYATRYFVTHIETTSAKLDT